MIEIIEADLSTEQQSTALLTLLNDYAVELGGEGKVLPEYTRAHLIDELKKRKSIYIVMAHMDEEAAGLVITIEGFSTFAAKPLFNIHDVVVAPRFRGRGISKMMLEKVEQEARTRGCCKLTLEVLEHNHVAKNLYRSFGFISYELDPSYGKAEVMEKKL
jgi:ribosomal protein S18 acetylase RimI-like enzyme